MPETPPSISLLGLGKMGHPMAGRLVDKYGTITVWNRTPGRAEDLALRGAVIAESPRSAAQDVVLTVLTDLSAVEEVLRGDAGLVAGWQERGIPRPKLVIHGTVSPTGTVKLAEELAQLGVSLIDAPLSGGVLGAEEGTLSIMVGGHREDVDELRPVFEQMGKTVRYLGPCGSGQLAKACNQIVVAAGVVALSESVLLARKSGLDVETVLELLAGGLAGSELLRQKGEKWLTEAFVAGGSGANQLKDLRFAEDAAVTAGLVLPLTRTVTGLFEQMVNAGEGELDHTGVYRTIERLFERRLR